MSSPIWRGNNTAGLVEQPMARVNRGDTAAWEQVFVGPYDVCRTAMPWKGAVGTGTASGYRVREAEVDRANGTIGTLRIIWEPYGAMPPADAQLPPDTMSIRVSSRRIPILQHPDYSDLADSDAWLEFWRRWTFRESAEDVDAILTGLRAGGGNATLGAQFVDQIVRDVTELDLPVLIVTEIEHAWTFPAMSLGGEMTTAPDLPDAASWPAGYTWKLLGDEADWNGSYWSRKRVYEGMLSGVLEATIP